MVPFPGFPSGKNPYVPIPEVFFTVLLPEIEDSAELKVTLHLFWLLAQKQGNPRCVSDRDLIADRLLMRSLKRRGDPRPLEERLHQGLERAVARGILLHVRLRLLGEESDEGEMVDWYFFNTHRSRKAVADLQGGDMLPVHLFNVEQETDVRSGVQSIAFQDRELAFAAPMHTISRDYEATESAPRMQIEIEHPNIFVLYEQNIGLLSPLLADQLQDAADRYPPEWIEAAFREALQQNKRKWSYISAILRRWETEGR